MKRYPKFVLYLNRIAENASRVVEFCANRGVDVCAVPKGAAGDHRVARAMLDGGCGAFADSRISNLAVLKNHFPGIPRTLLRIPMKSEVKDAVRVADCSLVSMPESVEALSAACAAEGVTHNVILMFDLGDRREGVLDGPASPASLASKPGDGLEAFIEVFKKTPLVTLQGVGVNFGCFAGVLPSGPALRRLCLAREALERELARQVPICSGGSTSSLLLMERGELPEGVNQLRVGEAILLGQDVTWRRAIPWLRQDTTRLEAEVVESRVKPSLPEGDTGANAFGEETSFEDEGEQLRVIAAIGRQDVNTDGMKPMAGLRMLGASSDHTILAGAADRDAPRWGDVLEFSVNYAAMLALMTSPYVFKEYKKHKKYSKS